MDHVFYDLETTGSDSGSCKIVEFCFADALSVLFTEFVNPGRPIAAEATAVHGIKTTDVLTCKPFSEYATFIQELIDDVILVGFNNIRFDSIVLDRELREAGMPGLHKDEHGIIDHHEIDLFAIWQRSEKRDLKTAAMRFARCDLVNAHSATADTEVLPIIMSGMRREFNHEGMDYSAMSIPEGAVDREGKFIHNKDGIVVFSFGKHKNDPVQSSQGRQYLKWMLTASFSDEVNAHCRRFLG